MSEPQHRRQPDYYAVLNLPAGSAFKDVQEQYRKLVKVFHPDRNAGDAWYGEQLKRYNEAYEFLSSPDRKATYDESRDRRASDVIPFEHSFEADVAVDLHSEPEEAWSFNTGDVPIGAAKTINLDPKVAEVFSNATVVVPPRIRTVPIESAKRTRTIRLSIAAAATLVGLFVFIAIKMQPDDNALAGSAAEPVAGPSAKLALPKAASTLQIDSPLAGSSPSSDANSAIQGASPGSMDPPPITSHDIQVADAEQHKDALKRKSLVAPYWLRYQSLQPSVYAAIESNQKKLNDMQAQDMKGSADAQSEVRRQSEASLWENIRGTKDKLATIQSQFDDLEYVSSSDDARESLNELDQELNDLKRYASGSVPAVSIKHQAT